MADVAGLGGVDALPQQAQFILGQMPWQAHGRRLGLPRRRGRSPKDLQVLRVRGAHQDEARRP